MNKNNILIFYFGRLLHLLHSDEHQEYVTAVIAAIDARVLAIGDTELTTLWNAFKNLAAIEDLLYRQPKSAEETVTITNLNAKRTAILIYIFNAIDNIVKYSPHADDVAKAMHLDHVSEPYKEAPGKNITGKSADIRNLIKDFMQEPNATYATDLNLMKTLPLLGAANNEVESNYSIRAKLWLEKEKYGTLTQLHPKEDEAMTNVADTLEFLYRLNERGAKNDALRAQFDAIFTEWNALTEQFVRTLAQRDVTVFLDKPSTELPTPPVNPTPPSPPTPTPPDFE